MRVVLLALGLLVACASPQERAARAVADAVAEGQPGPALTAYGALRDLDGEHPELLRQVAELELREGSVGLMLLPGRVELGALDATFGALVTSPHPAAAGARARVLDALDRAVADAERQADLAQSTGGDAMGTALVHAALGGARRAAVRRCLDAGVDGAALAARYRDDAGLAALIADHAAGTLPPPEPDRAAQAIAALQRIQTRGPVPETPDPLVQAAGAVAGGDPDAVDRLVALVEGEGGTPALSGEDLDALSASTGDPLVNLRQLNRVVEAGARQAQLEAALALAADLPRAADRQRVHAAALAQGTDGRAALARQLLTRPDPDAAATLAALTADPAPAVWAPAWRARAALGGPDLLPALAEGLLAHRDLLLAALVLDALGQ